MVLWVLRVCGLFLLWFFVGVGICRLFGILGDILDFVGVLCVLLCDAGLWGCGILQVVVLLLFVVCLCVTTWGVLVVFVGLLVSVVVASWVLLVVGFSGFGCLCGFVFVMLVVLSIFGFDVVLRFCWWLWCLGVLWLFATCVWLLGMGGLCGLRAL